MYRISRILLVVFFALHTGCVSTGADREAATTGYDMPQRYSLPPVNSSRAEPREGAIFSEQSVDFYSDSRARNIGDIVLVKIVETSSGNKKASTTANRDSSMTGGVTSFFGVEAWLDEKNPRYTPSATNIQAQLASDFSGSGETKRDSNVTASISARVVDITMNGNLGIRGYKEVRLNNETQHIILTGIIRPEDISHDNTVLSSYIADARIEYSGTGTVADKQQPGWLARGIDVIWPF
ncbi:MAG: flagellar basal body L-ring protein FlgH [Desulfobulbaceae bacterium]|nr:flagellar basal body L-ring protein FlgH [Desulfobulbaceae bacterium]